jgi:hypothetical protein
MKSSAAGIEAGSAKTHGEAGYAVYSRGTGRGNPVASTEDTTHLRTGHETAFFRLIHSPAGHGIPN